MKIVSNWFQNLSDEKGSFNMPDNRPHLACIAAQIPDQEFLVLKALLESLAPTSWAKPTSNAHLNTITLLLQHQLPVQAVGFPSLEHEHSFITVASDAGQRLICRATPGLNRVRLPRPLYNR